MTSHDTEAARPDAAAASAEVDRSAARARRPRGRKGGRRSITSREAMLDAARTIGLAKLTVGAVTAAVGIQHSTFYKYWSSRDALRDALVDKLLAPLRDQTERPARATATAAVAGPWAAALRDACTTLAELLDAHDGLAHALLGQSVLAGNLRCAHTTLTTRLTEADFAHTDAEAVVSTALRTTIAAAVGATALLPATGPDPGLPPVILHALHAAARRPGPLSAVAFGPDLRGGRW